MELFNIQVEAIKRNEIVAKFYSEPYEEARRLNAQLIHWLPCEEGFPCDVVMPDGSILSGLVEGTFRRVSSGSVTQFERFGFVRVDEVNHKAIVFFSHK